MPLERGAPVPCAAGEGELISSGKAPQPKLSLIVAVSDNDVIGKDNQLPWHLSADLRYFKQRTMGKPIVMGRKTWESIGRPLPGRDNIVISRDADYRAEGATVVHSLDAALAHAADADEIMIIGGASVYEAALPLVDRIYMTRVHVTVDGGDTIFRPPAMTDWRERCRHFLAGERGDPDCTFIVKDRH